MVCSRQQPRCRTAKKDFLKERSVLRVGNRQYCLGPSGTVKDLFESFVPTSRPLKELNQEQLQSADPDVCCRAVNRRSQDSLTQA